MGLSIYIFFKVKPNNSSWKLSQIVQTPLLVHELSSDKTKGNGFAEFLILVHAFYEQK